MTDLNLIRPPKGKMMIFRLLACLIALSVTTALAQTTGVKPAAATTSRATFAGGCFWCMEPPFDHLDGVISTTSGYIGGRTKNPSYQEVSSGVTGHAEAVQVVYDPPKSPMRSYWKCSGAISIRR
jgi:Peptide methionine sulfoxide reductase